MNDSMINFTNSVNYSVQAYRASSCVPFDCFPEISGLSCDVNFMFLESREQIPLGSVPPLTFLKDLILGVLRSVFQEVSVWNSWLLSFIITIFTGIGSFINYRTVTSFGGQINRKKRIYLWITP